MSTRGTIVVIQDEPDILEVVRHHLAREGYRVLTSSNGEEGLIRVRHFLPNLVLLDVVLPGIDGLEVCRRIQSDAATASIPVIMVTARGDESDVLVGLQMGADDYVIKPFRPKELVARVGAVLRRGRLREEHGPGARIVRAGLVIDPIAHQVTIDRAAIDVTATEMRLSHFLATRPGRVFVRDQLLSQVISNETVVTERNIDVHVASLRRKLGAYRGLIETVRGVGYRFQDNGS